TIRSWGRRLLTSRGRGVSELRWGGDESLGSAKGKEVAPAGRPSHGAVFRRNSPCSRVRRKSDGCSTSTRSFLSAAFRRPLESAEKPPPLDSPRMLLSAP